MPVRSVVAACFASRVVLPSVALGFVAVVAIIGIILSWRAPKPRWFFVLAPAAVLSALRFNLSQPHFDRTTLATYNDQPKPIIAEPDLRDTYTNLRVEADQLIIADQPTRTVKGLVLVQAPPFTDYRYGDHVRAKDAD